MALSFLGRLRVMIAILPLIWRVTSSVGAMIAVLMRIQLIATIVFSRRIEVDWKRGKLRISISKHDSDDR
jgi:hypothetical protein